jgi:predicted RNA-binding Zn ribbon-like protein
VSSKPEELPHSLDLVIGFVNTLDIERGEDELLGDDFAAWFVDAALLERGARVGEGDRARAIALREALRSVMTAHNGGAADANAAQQLEQAAREGELGVHFRVPDAAATIAPRAEGFSGALAGLLVPVTKASADGTWKRVKACRAADCRWGFYDRSRNRSGVWCEMAVCGNRTKVRAYRGRVEGRRP